MKDKDIQRIDDLIFQAAQAIVEAIAIMKELKALQVKK